MGGFIIGLYNILLLFILYMIVKDQNWAQMWQFGILVLVEGVVLGTGGFAYLCYQIMGGYYPPLYDVNPVPYGDELSLLVDDEDNSISTVLAIRTAYRFGILENYATKIAEKMRAIIRDNWEQLAKEYGLTRGQIEYMRPAFGLQ